MQGIAAPHVAPAVKNYDKYIGEMEAALSDSPYLVGENYSLADVADWLRRIRARPSYNRAITDYFTDVEKERFDFPREETARKVREILRVNINEATSRPGY
jgi:glutathione S-transferase